MGKLVASLLYSKIARVYVAARSEERANKAIDDIKKAYPSSKGSLAFMKLGLSDLSLVKASANFFLSRECKLNGLFNNAGAMYVDTKGPQDTVQGFEMNLGVNVIGLFLLTKLLTPALAAAVPSEPEGSVRVVWLCSIGTELIGERSRGMTANRDMAAYKNYSHMDRYALSKAANWLHAVEYARRMRSAGIVSVPLNPGNNNTELARQHPALVQFFLRRIVYPPVYGAYTQLYAAFSKDIGLANSGIWGEFRHYLRQHRVNTQRP